MKPSKMTDSIYNGTCRIIIWIILVLLLFLNASQSAFADAGDMISSDLADEIIIYYETDGLYDSDKLASEFIGRLMPGYDQAEVVAQSTRGSMLTGPELTMYTLLHEDISAVANGNRSSTMMLYDAAAVFDKTEYTAAELGDIEISENGNVTQEAMDAINAIIRLDFDKVIGALIADCPYELYWYDRTGGIAVEFTDRFDTDGNTVSFSGNYLVSFPVAAEYALNGEQYQYDTTYGQNARAAAEAAQWIVDRYLEASDAEKLLGYEREICALTAYNFDALEEDVSYGNPWQIIWVFDGDQDTNVVCEGYAKAFQYLCDLTVFSVDAIQCKTVTGTMTTDHGTPENHMWNVVTMEDEQNYLVDITNCDSGTVGAPYELFLAGSSGGSVATGYVVDCNSTELLYQYDTATTSLFSEAELMICCESYGGVLTQLVAGGVCESGQTWELYEDGLCIVRGENAITDAGWIDYSERITKLVFSEGIQTFYYLPEADYPLLEEIEFPNSLNQIDTLFGYMPSLKKINIPPAVQFLPSFLFSDCRSLQTVSLSEGLISIGMGCFSGCSALSDITIPTTVEVVEDYAFQECTSLEQVSVAQGKIGEGAFYGCTSLSNVELGEKVTDIGISAFSGCFALQEIHLPASICSIGNSAFCYCRNLASEIIIPEGVTVIEQSTFMFCEKLQKVVLPQTLERIESGAFQSSGLQEIVTPDSVQEIGSCAFAYCPMKTVTMGNGVLEIGTDAFRGGAFPVLHLPASLVSIEFNSMGNCDIEAVDVDDDNLYYSDVDGILYNKEKTSLIYCPANKTGEIIIPDGVLEILPQAFQHSKLTAITVPDTVHTIGKGAFSICDYLQTATLPSSLTVIPDNLFYFCQTLSAVTIPSSVVKIGSGAFADCAALQQLMIPAGIQEIGDAAFSGCNNLDIIFEPNAKYVCRDGMILTEDGETLLTVLRIDDPDFIVPDGVEVVAKKCFVNSNVRENLYRISFPDSVRIIAESACEGCTGLKEIIFGQGLEEIGYFAFQSTGIENLILPERKIRIGSSAFEYCQSLETVTIPGVVNGLGPCAFNGCSSLNTVQIHAIEGDAWDSSFSGTPYYNDESNWVDGCFYVGGWLISVKDEIGGDLVIPEGTTGIASYALDNNLNLTSVWIPGSVKVVGRSSFDGCKYLNSIQLNEGLISISESAFANSYVSELIIPSTVRYIGYNFFSSYYICDLLPVKFMGNAPSFDENAFINIGKAQILYPSGDPTWDDVVGSAFGSQYYETLDLYGNVIARRPSCIWACYDAESGEIINSSIQLPANMEYIEEEAFADCTFEYVQLPYGLREIKSKAFSNCTMLKEIVIPESVTVIADSAFDGCASTLIIVGQYGSAAEEFAANKGYAFVNMEGI